MMKLADLLQDKAFINGQWLDSDSTFQVVNPFNNTLIIEVVDCDIVLANKAIDAASKAFEIWRNFSVKKRARILLRWYDLIVQNTQPLAEILTLEMGKPISEAKGEIRYGANYIQWFAEEAKRVYGDIIPGPSSDKRSLVIKQPIGVVGAITPWNFPNAMISRKVAPALAAGCTVIIKPSEETPLSALALGVLAEKAGFPPGVINIIPTNRPSEIGVVFCEHPKVRKISFTGSTQVGKMLMRNCASGLKKLSLELGGNAPFIVFNDADLEQAAEGLMDSKFRNSGQTCVCANRIFVQNDIVEEFISLVKNKMKDLTCGSGMDETVKIGPLINQKAMQKVEGLVEDAVQAGAEMLCGGKSDKGGLLFEPTVLNKVNTSMRIAKEEIFGPVISIIPFDSEEDAIHQANDTQYGLASYFYSENMSRCFRVAEALEYGMVGVNTGVISSEMVPFGGVKESGMGREGSKYGISDYLEIKYICLGGI